jgi:hypothetical protein
MSDKTYRKTVMTIIEGPYSRSLYDQLLQATGRRLMMSNRLTLDELKSKLILHLVREATAAGRLWMHPIHCFSSHGILASLNIKLDDSLSKVYSNKDAVSFEILMDIMGYLVLYRLIEKKQRRSTFKKIIDAVKEWYYYG